MTSTVLHNVTSAKVIMTFTYRALDRILSEGGSGAWTCKQSTAAECKYLIVTRNSHGVPARHGHPGYPAEGNEPHGTAFLIGRVSKVIPDPDVDPDPKATPRYRICIDRWAPLNLPKVWKGDRLPFRYTTLEECGITDVDALDWQDMPPPKAEPVSQAGATVPLVLPAVRTIEQIAAELRNAIAAERKTSPDNVTLNVSVKVEEAFSI